MASGGGLLSAGSDIFSLLDPFAPSKQAVPVREAARPTGLSADLSATAATQPRAAPLFAAGAPTAGSSRARFSLVAARLTPPRAPPLC